MRITSANIPAPVSKPSTSLISPATDKTTPKHQTTAASDSYKKNSGPQIIDAEYVEFYSPSIKLFNQERQDLDTTLELEDVQFEVTGSNRSAGSVPALNEYALKAHEAPPPGSYVDIFA